MLPLSRPSSYRQPATGHPPQLIAAILLLAVLLATPLHAQQHENVAKGFAADKVYQFSDLDPINLFNLSLNVALPIGPKYPANGNLHWGLGVHYSGNNWSPIGRTVNVSNPSQPAHYVTYIAYQPYEYTNTGLSWNAGLGWNVSFGRLLPPGVEPCVCWTYESEDGAKHDFFPTLHETNSAEPSEDGVGYSSDGSYLRMTTVGTSWRDVEFPDGTIRRFPYGGGRATEIRDHFNNRISIVADSQQNGLPRWRIDDGSRVAYVNFILIDGFSIVKTIDLPAILGRRAIYTFHYGITPDHIVSYAADAPDGSASVSRRYPDKAAVDCNVAPAVRVPVLTSIVLADGSSFEMHYDLGDDGASFSRAYPAGTSPTPSTICTAFNVTPGFSGNLTSLRLPTLGTLEWDYTRYVFPGEGAVSHQRIEFSDLTSVREDVLTSAEGVRERRERDADSTLLSRRTYAMRYYKVRTDDTAYAALTTVKSWSDFTAAQPLGSVFSRAVHYFSVGTTPGGIAKTGEYSLPFTRFPFTAASGDPEAADSALLGYNETDPVTGVANPDPADGSRFLSTKLYDGAGHLLQYKYVAYEGDDPDIGGGQQADRRQRSERIVWNDAHGNAATDAVTLYSDFDGLGHYRTTTESGSGYATSSTRTTTTAFNRADDAAGGTILDSGSYSPSDASSFSMVPSSAPWILETFTRQTVTEGSDSTTTLSCFDRATGLLLRRRTMSGSTPAADDLLAVQTPDAHGNIATEQSFGGARSDLAAGPLCSMPLPPPVYETRHECQFGVLARTRAFDPAANALLPFSSLDQSIDPAGLALTSTDSAGLVTTYDYDSLGRLGTVTPPGGETPTVYSWANASASSPAAVTISRTASATNAPEDQFLFDGLGRLSLERRKQHDGSYATRATRYDALGRRAAVSEWETTPSHWTSTTFDLFNRPLTITSPDGHTSTLAYSANASLIRSTPLQLSSLGEALATVTELYDRFGRLVLLREGSGTNNAPVDTSYTYDAGNRLTSATTLGQTRTFTYDHRGLLTASTSPEKAAVSYGPYDARGHALRVVDGPFDLTYAYDAAERLRTVTQTGGADLKTFTYATANVPAGCTSGCTEWSNGHLLSATRRHDDAALGGTVNVTETWHYADPAGRPSSRDTSISSTTLLPGATFTTSQTYDALGQVRQLTYPRCTAPAACAAATPLRNASRAYAHGWLTSVDGDAGNYATLSYQPNGLVATVSHANGVDETWIGDPSGLPRPCAIFASGKGTHLTANASAPCGTTFALDAGATTGVQWTTGRYAYDGAGNVTSIGMKRYVYDAASRLVAENDGSAYWSTYRYDPFGNLTQQSFVHQGGDFVARSLSATPVDPSTNHLTAATYDAAGNMTATAADASASTFTWDAAGTMRSLADPGRELHFLYTAGDERIATVALPPSLVPRTTWTLRGFDNQLLRTVTNDGTSWSWTEDEVWRDGALLATVTPTTTRHPILDHLGTPRLITDTSPTASPASNDFSSFGSGGTLASGSLQFTAHERDFGPDATRTFDYMHARYYSAALSRFLSVDPAVDAARASHEPQLWNGYAYARGNPLTAKDPTGRCDQKPDEPPCSDMTIEVEASAPTKAEQTVDLIDQGLGKAVELSGVGTVMAGILNDSPTQVATGVVQQAALVAPSAANAALVGPTRVFWSGGLPQAGAAAETYAREIGGKTLEMTVSGKLLTAATKQFGFEAVKPAWELASWNFARGAAGEVAVVHNGYVGATSVWARIEFPTLIKTGAVQTIKYFVLVGGKLVGVP